MTNLSSTFARRMLRMLLSHYKTPMACAQITLATAELWWDIKIRAILKAGRWLVCRKSNEIVVVLGLIFNSSFQKSVLKFCKGFLLFLYSRSSVVDIGLVLVTISSVGRVSQLAIDSWAPLMRIQVMKSVSTSYFVLIIALRIWWFAHARTCHPICLNLCLVIKF